MRVLLTGANGFIGRYLLAGLVQAGHDVVPAVRRPAETDRLLARPASIRVDFNRDVEPAIWLPRLAGIDAVVNCVGVLQGGGGQAIAAIHDAAPRALFAACAAAGVRRVVQISAISAEAGAGTEYARTKKRADDFLAATDLEWVILRPSLVIAEGAFGGTALLRALAALPWVTPIPGDGRQAFMPIHVDDVVATVARILAEPSIRRVVIDPVGPDVVTLRDLLARLRRWLGLPPARVVAVPPALMRAVARVGDVVGGTVNTTALRQLEFGNVGSLDAFVGRAGIRPRAWETALLARPAQGQDRWHARLYFLRPLLRGALGLLWLGSGIVGLLQPTTLVVPLLEPLGAPPALAPLAGIAGSLADLAIGIGVLARWRPGVLALLQLGLIALYTVVLTVADAALWLDPFGRLLKNIPIMVAVLMLAALERER